MFINPYLTAFFCLCCLFACNPVEKPQNHLPSLPKGKETAAKSQGLQNGDIIFQVSLSPQTRPIQLATHAAYSHCGILFQQKGAWYVFEAIQPVTYTKLEDWAARGEKGHYVVKRLKQAGKVLTPATLQKMQTAGKQYLGKPYDIYFGWSDDRIYCSELVWKIYHQTTGISLGKMERLGNFDLTHPVVKAALKERYGNQIPLQEQVISPAAIFDAAELEEVMAQ